MLGAVLEIRPANARRSKSSAQAANPIYKVPLLTQSYETNTILFLPLLFCGQLLPFVRGHTGSSMLCQFSQNFPEFVEGFLNQSKKLSRSFREETVTDILMGGLITANAQRVFVEFPNELVTGADMEWNFVHLKTSRFFRIILQAKRAEGKGDKWKRHSYKHLYHKPAKSTKLQIETLCDTATNATNIATYPLYIFYHPQHTASLARNDGKREIRGVNIADAYEVRRLVRKGMGSSWPASYRNLGAVEPLLMPLSYLFCPDHLSPLSSLTSVPRSPGATFTFSISDPFSIPQILEPPTPDDIRRRLLAARDRARFSTADVENLAIRGDRFDIPEVSTSIPQDVEKVLERVALTGRPQDVGAPLDRWRLTFVSNGSLESDTGPASIGSTE
ncbi:DUF6615 family protein [Rhizobium ruizarguesonis]